MAYILLKPDENRKGIVIFKHSELPLLAAMPNEQKIRLKSVYIVGSYFGYYIKNLYSDEADFIVADNNLIDNNKSKSPRVFLNGFNFISDDNNDGISLKEGKSHNYDFVTVASTQRRKNIPLLIKLLGEMSSEGWGFKAIILNRATNTFEGYLVRKRIRNLLAGLAQKNRKQIRYIELSPGSDMLPKDLVYEVLRRSRVLVCPSKVEGAARVVGEATVNDLMVVSNGEMKGGTNNYLDPEHDIVYFGESGLKRALIKMLVRGERGASYAAKNKHYYDSSRARSILAEFLVSHFDLSEETRAQIERAALEDALSGHQNELPSGVSNPRTDEIYDRRTMYRFVCWLCGDPIEAMVDRRMQLVDFCRALFRTPRLLVKNAYLGVKFVRGEI